MKDPQHAPTSSGLAVSSDVDQSATTTPAMKTKQAWNTDKLGLRLGADLVSAATAGAMVAPVISIIDRSIMENASGRNTLLASLKNSFKTLLLRPHTVVFSKPVALILMLYGGTYLTANTLDTATSTVQNRSPSHVTAGTPKFAASSAANVGLCIYKDQVYVRMFGPAGAVPRAVPMLSYTLFAMRDCMTIFASFNVPPLLAPKIEERLTGEWKKRLSGVTCAQFIAPAAVQLCSTPLHLLGLDMYNRPKEAAGAPGWRERWELVRKNWAPSAMARICRIVPAFGVGGVVNTKMRKRLMSKLE